MVGTTDMLIMDSLENIAEKVPNFKGLPTHRDEDWRYIQLKPIYQTKFSMPHDPYQEKKGDSETIQIDLVNKVITVPSQLAEGVSIELKSALSNTTDKNPFRVMNTHFSEKSLVIHIEKSIKKPLQINLVANESDRPMFWNPKIEVALKPGVSAEVEITQSIQGEGHFCNLGLDLAVSDKATLKLVMGHHTQNNTVHMMSLRGRLEKKSKLETTSLITSDSLTVEDYKLDLCGEDSECYVNGLSILKETAQSFSKIWMNHLVPNCKTKQVFKNILYESAISEFNSLSYVHPKAHGVDSIQSNKNLLLSDNARSYARPQLIIEADDVICAHGSNTGQLSEEEMFYLESRGLSREQAKSVLTKGFAEDVLSMISNNKIKTKYLGVLDDCLF